MNDTDGDLEYLPNRTALREYAIPEQDDVDTLVDSLWRHGSAQDYPAPEPEYPARLRLKHLDERRWSQYHEYTDQRSLTRDLKLDDPPVPGYREFPTAIAKTINFKNAHAKQITQASQADGRRSPQSNLRQTRRNTAESRSGIQSGRRQSRNPQKQKTEKMIKSDNLKPSNLSAWAALSWKAK